MRHSNVLINLNSFKYFHEFIFIYWLITMRLTFLEVSLVENILNKYCIGCRGFSVQRPQQPQKGSGVNYSHLGN